MDIIKVGGRRTVWKAIEIMQVENGGPSCDEWDKGGHYDMMSGHQS